MFLLFDLGLQTLAIYVLAAIVPAISLLVYIYRHDKIEQEQLVYYQNYSGVVYFVQYQQLS